MDFGFNTRLRFGAIILQAHKILAVKPENYSKYILPGGAIALFESPNQCIKREIREELACRAISTKFLGAYYSKEKKRNKITAAFLVKIKGRPKPSAEIEEAKWLSGRDLNKFGPHTRKIILDLIKAKLLQ